MCYYTVKVEYRNVNVQFGYESDYVSKYRSPSTKRKAVLPQGTVLRFVDIFYTRCALHIGFACAILLFNESVKMNKTVYGGFGVKSNEENRLAKRTGEAPAVRDESKQLAVSTGAAESGNNKETEKSKKKNHVGTIIVIVLIVLVTAAAAFFGYRYYVGKLSEDILSDMTGTWIFDTGSEEVGYFEFRGNSEVTVNGDLYSVTADKEKLTFTLDERSTDVEYRLDGEQLMLMLDVENELLESCALTVSDSDLSGVLLYRISDSHSLDFRTIQAAYRDKFPEYIEADISDILDIFGDGSFDYGELEALLPEWEDVDSIESFFSTYASDAYEEYMAENDEFDFSEFVSEYFTDWGAAIGGMIADEIDGTEVEDFIEGVYGAWQIYESLEDGDYEDIFGSIEDWDWSDWGW